MKMRNTVFLVAAMVLVGSGVAAEFNHSSKRIKRSSMEAHKPSQTGQTAKNKSSQISLPKHSAGASQPVVGGRAAAPPVINLDALQQLDHSVKLAEQGDAQAKRGNQQQAIQYYQEALNIWPKNHFALYGLGRYADAAGDTARAVEYYHTAIYTDNPTQSSDGWQEGNVAPLMEYALLLSKAGQAKEARVVYRRAVDRLNYVDGKPHLDVLLPDFRPGGWAYTPRRLQAMAHTAIAIEQAGFDDASALSHHQQAIALAPDSPLPFFYRGRFRDSYKGDSKSAKADYEQARRLGDGQVGAAVDKAMNP